jgi:hypothetical protein
MSGTLVQFKKITELESSYYRLITAEQGGINQLYMILIEGILKPTHDISIRKFIYSVQLCFVSFINSTYESSEQMKEQD